MARALAIDARLEKLLPHTEELFLVGCYTKPEIQEIYRRRTHFEYRLVANPLLLNDVLESIEFEMDIERKIAAMCANRHNEVEDANARDGIEIDKNNKGDAEENIQKKRRAKIHLRHRWAVQDRIESIYGIGLKHLSRDAVKIGIQSVGAYQTNLFCGTIDNHYGLFDEEQNSSKINASERRRRRERNTLALYSNDDYLSQLLCPADWKATNVLTNIKHENDDIVQALQRFSQLNQNPTTFKNIYNQSFEESFSIKKQARGTVFLSPFEILRRQCIYHLHIVFKRTTAVSKLYAQWLLSNICVSHNPHYSGSDGVTRAMLWAEGSLYEAIGCHRFEEGRALLLLAMQTWLPYYKENGVPIRVGSDQEGKTTNLVALSGVANGGEVAKAIVSPLNQVLTSILVGAAVLLEVVMGKHLLAETAKEAITHRDNDPVHSLETEAAGIAVVVLDLALADAVVEHTARVVSLPSYSASGNSYRYATLLTPSVALTVDHLLEPFQFVESLRRSVLSRSSSSVAYILAQQSGIKGSSSLSLGNALKRKSSLGYSFEQFSTLLASLFVLEVHMARKNTVDTRTFLTEQVHNELLLLEAKRASFATEKDEEENVKRIMNFKRHARPISKIEQKYLLVSGVVACMAVLSSIVISINSSFHSSRDISESSIFKKMEKRKDSKACLILSLARSFSAYGGGLLTEGINKQSEQRAAKSIEQKEASEGLNNRTNAIRHTLVMKSLGGAFCEAILQLAQLPDVNEQSLTTNHARSTGMKQPREGTSISGTNFVPLLTVSESSALLKKVMMAQDGEEGKDPISQQFFSFSSNSFVTFLMKIIIASSEQKIQQRPQQQERKYDKKNTYHHCSATQSSPQVNEDMEQVVLAHLVKGLALTVGCIGGTMKESKKTQNEDDEGLGKNVMKKNVKSKINKNTQSADGNDIFAQDGDEDVTTDNAVLATLQRSTSLLKQLTDNMKGISVVFSGNGDHQNSHHHYEETSLLCTTDKYQQQKTEKSEKKDVCERIIFDWRDIFCSTFDCNVGENYSKLTTLMQPKDLKDWFDIMNKVRKEQSPPTASATTRKGEANVKKIGIICQQQNSDEDEEKGLEDNESAVNKGEVSQLSASFTGPVYTADLTNVMIFQVLSMVDICTVKRDYKKGIVLLINALKNFYIINKDDLAFSTEIWRLIAALFVLVNVYSKTLIDKNKNISSSSQNKRGRAATTEESNSDEEDDEENNIKKRPVQKKRQLLLSRLSSSSGSGVNNKFALDVSVLGVIYTLDGLLEEILSFINREPDNDNNNKVICVTVARLLKQLFEQGVRVVAATVSHAVLGEYRGGGYPADEEGLVGVHPQRYERIQGLLVMVVLRVSLAIEGLDFRVDKDKEVENNKNDKHFRKKKDALFSLGLLQFTNKSKFLAAVYRHFTEAVANVFSSVQSNPTALLSSLDEIRCYVLPQMHAMSSFQSSKSASGVCIPFPRVLLSEIFIPVYIAGYLKMTVMKSSLLSLNSSDKNTTSNFVDSNVSLGFCKSIRMLFEQLIGMYEPLMGHTINQKHIDKHDVNPIGDILQMRNEAFQPYFFARKGEKELNLEALLLYAKDQKAKNNNSKTITDITKEGENVKDEGVSSIVSLKQKPFQIDNANVKAIVLTNTLLKDEQVNDWLLYAEMEEKVMRDLIAGSRVVKRAAKSVENPQELLSRQLQQRLI